MAEVYDQKQESHFFEEERNLPTSFTTVRTVLGGAATSLSEDYAGAPPERRAAYTTELGQLEEARQQELIDSHGIRF